MQGDVTKEIKVGIHEEIVEPTLLHGSKVWVLHEHERNICGVRRIDKVRNLELRRKCRKQLI